MRKQSYRRKFGFRPEEAAEQVGSRVLFSEMRRAGWVKPVIDRHKLVLFDASDIERAWSRILSGETPPRINTP
jgi:hypothetical protein